MYFCRIAKNHFTDETEARAVAIGLDNGSWILASGEEGELIPVPKPSSGSATAAQTNNADARQVLSNFNTQLQVEKEEDGTTPKYNWENYDIWPETLKQEFDTSKNEYLNLLANRVKGISVAQQRKIDSINERLSLHNRFLTEATEGAAGIIDEPVNWLKKFSDTFTATDPDVRANRLNDLAGLIYAANISGQRSSKYLIEQAQQKYGSEFGTSFHYKLQSVADVLISDYRSIEGIRNNISDPFDKAKLKGRMDGLRRTLQFMSEDYGITVDDTITLTGEKAREGLCKFSMKGGNN